MLAETAAEAARRFGAAPAFVTDEGLTLGYEQFDTAADEVAVALAELGVGEGDVVALLLPSVPEHFVAYVAAAKLGAVTAAVNPKLVQAERGAVLRAANPRLLVTTEDLAAAGSDEPCATVLIEPVAGSAEALFEGVRHRGERPPPSTPTTTVPSPSCSRRGRRGRRRVPCSAGASCASSPSATSARPGAAAGTPWPARRWRIWAPPPSWRAT